MNPRSLPCRLIRLLLPVLLCLMGVPGGVRAQDYYTPPQVQPQRKPLFDKMRDWWERRKAPKAEYDHNPYAYTDGKQPVSRIDPPEWQTVPPIQYDWKERTYQFSKALYKLNWQVEEWGSIQMAPLVLYPARYNANTPRETYPFALDATSPAPPQNGQPVSSPFGLQGMYNEYGKAEGGSLSVVREQFRGSVAANLDASGADATKVITTPAPGATATKTAVEGLGDDTSNKLATATKVDLSSATFSPHSRVIEAADTTMVKNILTLMGKPDAALQYKDRKILYGVTTVSVNPGFLTKEGYVAHIDAQATVTYRRASREMISRIIRWNQLPFEARRLIAKANRQFLTAEEQAVFDSPSPLAAHSAPGTVAASSPTAVPVQWQRYFPPLPDNVNNVDGRPGSDGNYDEDTGAVIAINVVTPLMDTQNLALGSSSARQIELAMQLSALLGTAGSGSAFADWAKLNRRDTVTMSSLAAANAYSMGDNLFGFEVGNRLRGMANPEADDGKAGMILERQTFPALLMLGMHEELASPKLVRNAKNEPEVWMPELRISYNTRWSRHTRGWLWGAFDRNRLPEESYKIQQDLNKALSTLKSLDEHMDPHADEQQDKYHIMRNLARDYEVLTSSYFGTVTRAPLPADFLIGAEDLTSTLWDTGDKLVRANELKVYPSDQTIQSKATKASDAKETVYMMITGKNLDQVELAGIVAQGDGSQTVIQEKSKDGAVDAPKLIGTTAIGLWVELKGGVNGSAGSGGGGAALAAAATSPKDTPATKADPPAITTTTVVTTSIPVAAVAPAAPDAAAKAAADKAAADKAAAAKAAAAAPAAAGGNGTVQTTPNYFRFELPIKRDSPVLEMMKDGSVLTPSCSYQFALPAPAKEAKPEKKPTLDSLVREQIAGVGSLTNNKLTGSIDVMIKGTALSSWKEDDLEITVNPQGRGTYHKGSLNVLGDAGLFLTLDVEGKGPLAAFITFKVKSAREIYHSPAFDYTLSNP